MAIFLCLLSILPIILRIFGLEGSEGLLPALAVLVLDSSGFLTLLCIIAVIICFAKRINFLLVFYLADVLLINQLYLNERWPVYFDLLKTLLEALKGPNVLSGLFLAAIVLLGIWAFWKRPSSSKNNLGIPTDGRSNTENSTIKGTQTSTSSKTTTSNSAAQNKQEMSDESDSAFQKNEFPNGYNPSVSLLFAALFIGGIAVFVLDLVLNRAMGLKPPSGLEWLFQQLYPMALLCAGGLACIVAIRSFFSGGYLNGGMRVTAFLALIFEFIIIIWAVSFGKNPEIHVLDNVLNIIASNELIALVISPVLLFILLDLAFSILGSILSKKNEPVWINDSKKKVIAIEKGLTDLTLNLIIGFMNLLLFIPDFFNQLATLLLEKEDLFPYCQIHVEKENAEIQPSKDVSEEQEIPDESSTDLKSTESEEDEGKGETS